MSAATPPLSCLSNSTALWRALLITDSYTCSAALSRPVGIKLKGIFFDSSIFFDWLALNDNTQLCSWLVLRSQSLAMTTPPPHAHQDESVGENHCSEGVKTAAVDWCDGAEDWERYKLRARIVIVL